MIPLKLKHFNIKETRCIALDIDSAKFLISYWYGRTKVLYDNFIINKRKKTFLNFIESYEIFIRALYASGINQNELKKFVDDILNKSFDYILEKHISKLKKELLRPVFLNIFILSYSYESSNLNKKRELIEQMFSDKISFKDEEMEMWYKIIFNKHSFSVFEIYDSVLASLINDDFETFKKYLLICINESKEKGFRLLKNNEKSDNLLAKTIGFYNYSYDILKEGYLHLYKKYNFNENN